MAITTVLFDLDGTLLPMDQDAFMKAYFNGLSARAALYGYEAASLTDTVWKGTAAMVKNAGSKSNEAVFWEVFTGKYGKESMKDAAVFEEYYRTDFQKVKDVCGFNPSAASIVRWLKTVGLRVALATNPLFPAIATESRIRWAGLEPDDFELYTTYENSRRCKPNPDYYAEVAAALRIDPAECLMVGNDVAEDMVARSLGMKVFLLTDCLINKYDEDISIYPRGSFDTLQKFICRLTLPAGLDF